MDRKSKQNSTRRTTRNIPSPLGQSMAPYTHSTNTTEVSAATNDNVFLFDTVNSKDDSVVFHNSQGNDLLEVSAQNDFVSYARPHQLVQISTSKTRLQLQAPPVNVSQARQDAKTNIFTAALLEHICCLYVSNPRQRRQVLEELCSKLSEGGIISPVAFLDIFSAPRKQYQLGFSKLMEAVVDMVNKDPNTAVTPVQTPILAEDEARCVALIATPPVAPLMRIPSDPLSSFFTSRYSSDFNEIKSIGSGGFGSVYMVKNKLDEVFYAVKKVRLKQINHEKCKKLLREVKVLATLNHSSIVRYNSAWMEQQPDDMVIENISNETEDSSLNDSTSHNSKVAGSPPSEPFKSQKIVLYIQMELCHSNLHDWLAKRNKKLLKQHSHHDVYGFVQESENMHLTRQLLSGLDYIHTQGIIHRDIKTRNIFIGNHGALKIGDFGLARDVVATPSPTLIQRSPDWPPTVSEGGDLLSKGIGTSVYSSPEQKNQRTYDSKTDIYSAGIIIFELYCPFFTESERYKRIEELRNNSSVPVELLARWPEQIKMLLLMVDVKPMLRPSAKELLDSDLYLDKDQIILHLESRIQELETKNELLTQNNKMLQETMQIEASDYQLFLKWKNSSQGS